MNIKIAFSFFLFLGISTTLFAQSEIESDVLHSPFSEILMANVINGKVNYAGIKNDPRFTEYLDALKQARPDIYSTKEEKLAFWINAYNALAIKGILDGLSPSSFFGRISYFKTTEYEVAGRSINLYDLEREVIIPFNEPRIHFAIVCASFSCPNLRSEAYLAATLDQQLEDNALDFINDASKNEFDAGEKKARLSKIFDWFEKDFKKHSGSVQKYVARFVKDPSHNQALLQEAYRVKHLKYNWSLNGTPAD
jgi:Protein of unknown function, DUF547